LFISFSNLFDINGKTEIVPIKLKVISIDGFSGHSSRNELMAFVNNLNPKPRKIIINHGEQSKCLDLASSIYKSQRMETTVPKNLETISINVDYNEENKFFFYGYPNDNKGTPRGDLTHQGHVEEENYIFRLERVKDDDDDFLSGFSGSGVFTKNGNSYSLIGIFIRFEEEKGKYYYAVDVGKIINEIQKKLPINFLLYNDKVLKQVKEKKVKNKLSHIIHRDGYIEPRTVYIEELDIHVAVCPVTFEEYELFCKEKNIEVPHDSFWGRGQRPVINISWNDANDYCRWLTNKNTDNKIYRLPKSNEWELIAQKNIERADTLRKDAINLYLDAWFLDYDYVKEKILYVNYVRDRKTADVHLLGTTQSTGSGGTEYTLSFIGLNRLFILNFSC